MMMRLFRLLAVAVGVVALALPATGMAASLGKSTDRGVVQSVDAAQIVLRTLDGRVVAFSVRPATPVRLNGARASLSDVRPGYVVRVVSDGKARAVLVEAFGATPAAVTTTDRGTVTAITRSTITLRTVSGATVTLAVDGHTRFRFQGSPDRGQHVRTGAQVAVTHAADAPATLVNVLKRSGA